MPPGPSSLFLSPDHVAVVVLTIAGNLFVAVRARRDPGAPWVPRFRWMVAALLLANAAWTHVYLLASGRWDASWSLNCQLCDAATAACVVAMLRPTPLAFELAYFWGLGGALQGLITPAMSRRFPHPDFLQFFAVHVGVVTSALFLAFGLRMSPRRGVILRMILWTNAVAVVAGITNVVTGGNYMFLREPPSTGSLLDLLGPWPWYILGGEMVGVLVYCLLAVPFVLRARLLKAAYDRDK